MSFVHLHVHSEYSLLDGLSKVDKLVQRAKSLDMPALALTDHGAMFGAIAFYEAAKRAEIKPIIGIETYMAARGMRERDPQQDQRSFHLLLLAENDQGYQNLLKISSASQLEGFYYRPRIDHDFLAEHSEGLICTTGCLSGEVPRALQAGRFDYARELLDWYMSIFGPDRFFFELQHHEIPELLEINQKLIDLGGRYNAKFVATNDVHYVDPEDAELQDILLCIQTGSLVSDPNRMRMTDPSYYLRSTQEMQQLFGDVDGALSNTLSIAERCNVDLDFKGYHLPDFDVPQGYTPETYLRSLCEAGLQKRYGTHADTPQVRERLDYELRIIHEMGFDAYFLIVWDLCRFASEENIWYNARGSAAGSIVAYSLAITLVDPLEHGLIFERFLNPSRVSMPDIDLDFQDDLRYRMLEYTANKYGRDKVAQIITFGTLGARAAIRDVGRVKDIPLTDVDRIAKMIPAIPGKPITIPEALETVPALKEACDESPYLRELVDTAAKLEGVVRNAGTHAAGVIITDKLITDYVPLHRPTGGNLEENPIGSVTQFEMQILDDQGLLKVDFLGLSTLTVMARACKLIQERHGVDLDINSIPVDDPETFELLGRGDVLGVFQVEGVGMRRYLMDMKPRELANVIAMVALYRPGPMEFIPTYINRMHGNEKVSYPHPTLAKIFEETYGIPVYQEQIMFAAMELAGYSASEADSLRKAISKKKAKALGRHREKFILGAVEKGVEKATAVAVFDDWENFARYGFNKAHAADYGVIAVQTAYLKAHYALEYMTALLSVFKQDTDRVAIYVADCRRMAIDVLPPDINTSELDFAAQVNADGQAAIRFGLGAIKNVGHGPVQAILDARNEGGEFISLEDFARRTDLRMVGKRALESLIRVGALDHLASRIAMLEALDRIIAISSGYFRASEVGQLSFFGEATGVSDSLDIPKTLSNVPRRRLLAWEKELLGIYVSDHPLSPYLEELTKIVTHFSAELEETQQDQIVRVAGEITQIRPYQTRGGKAMGFVTLEDLQGQIELVIFTRVWKDAVRRLELDSIVVAEGKIDRDRGTPKILVDKISEEFKAFEARPMPVAQARPVRQDPDQNPPIERADQQPGNLAPSIDQPLQAAVQDEKPPLPIADAADEKPPLPRAGVADEIPAAFSETFEFSGYPARSNEPVTHSRLLAEVSDEIPVVSISTVNIGDDHTESEPKIITLMLDATGDRTRDALRMRRVHGLLNSYPGTDRFAFLLFEASHRYLLEFPSSSTGYCAELHAQLVELVGEHRIRIETLRYQ